VVTVGDKKIFAYEVNGKQEFKAFDDGNLPSLLSLPYLQFVKESDPIYVNTRAHILSKANPYFFESGKISGIGSSHTPPHNVWPLAIITQILTTQDKLEIKNCL
jgi:meiotically up-regulated gene 157 (Mug157) protein